MQLVIGLPGACFDDDSVVDATAVPVTGNWCSNCSSRRSGPLLDLVRASDRSAEEGKLSASPLGCDAGDLYKKHRKGREDALKKHDRDRLDGDYSQDGATFVSQPSLAAAHEAGNVGGVEMEVGEDVAPASQ